MLEVKSGENVRMGLDEGGLLGSLIMRERSESHRGRMHRACFGLGFHDLMHRV